MILFLGFQKKYSFKIFGFHLVNISITSFLSYTGFKNHISVRVNILYLCLYKYA
uniref:Uncharacterized protein n=1 Tax=Octopus bimaculoides TaxID=37653 RepID=A0A0L8GQG6_OCTBM